MQAARTSNYLQEFACLHPVHQTTLKKFLTLFYQSSTFPWPQWKLTPTAFLVCASKLSQFLSFRFCWLSWFAARFMTFTWITKKVGLYFFILSNCVHEFFLSVSSNPTWASFSIYTNGKKLFNVKRIESSGSIQCLDGLRAISLLWIIFGHRYFDMFLAPATNKRSATEAWLKNILSLPHTTFHLAVDTFFLIGGLLATWSFMKSFDKWVK